MELQNLQSKVVAVTIPVNGKDYTMNLKVCRVKARSVLFIEVNREERKNIFRQAPMKMLAGFTEDTITFKEGTQLKKWESGWDTIGQPSPAVASRGSFRPVYSNHSKGWAPTIKAPMGSSMDALAVSVSTRSTTNNPVSGFPMV